MRHLSKEEMESMSLMSIRDYYADLAYEADELGRPFEKRYMSCGEMERKWIFPVAPSKAGKLTKMRNFMAQVKTVMIRKDLADMKKDGSLMYHEF